jgi:tetratricopeptide (TPR) repeat protein
VAGNRKVFKRAMQAATDAAWDGKWSDAIEAYKGALGEFPDNVDALTGLGMAYASIDQPKDALDAYRRASELESDDPVLLERVGQALEQLGRRKEAAKAFLACGKQYMDQQQAPRLAAECWEAAVRLDPTCVGTRVALLKYYQRQGRIGEAVDQCLSLAETYRDQERLDHAMRICQHAVKLSPRSSKALAMLDELRYGGQGEGESQPQWDSESEVATEPGLPEAAILEFEASDTSEPAEQKGSPVELTRRRALSDLAESVFEEQEATATRAEVLSKGTIDALISKAIDFQTRGKAEEAIAAYEEVIASGADRPAVHFNLGLLYHDRLRFDEAVAEFQRAISHPDYRLGSHFALGECYRARGRIDEALEHFIEVLKIVDLATVERQHADDLINLYEHLTDGYLVKGDEAQALEFANSLVTFLNEQGWEDKVRVARQRLDVLTRDGPVVSLAEVLTVADSERILESIAMSQEYVRRGLFYTAMEECHFALESTPEYLPIHRQLAEVSLAMGKTEEAVEKFVVIGDAYQARGAARQASAMYERALKLAPMDTGVRTKLIHLLISHGEIDQALSHYLILADSHYHLAQMRQAREIYQEALRLAPRGDDERDWTVRILHRIGDIDMQQVSWRRAVSVYERIRELAPADERARVSLMELYYRLDEPEKAVQELDRLLEVYRDEGGSERMFAVLDDLIERWPDKISLRARAAQVHLDAGSIEEALEHLDRLGDLQLDAGRTEEAKATLRAIIALNPPDADEYQVLLDRIETGGWKNSDVHFGDSR